MTRSLLAALALATLGLSGPAAAEDCLCVGPEQAFADPALSLESPDPLAPVPEAVAPTPARPNAPVLWCMSENDPRCQRDDSGEAPHRITLATSPVAALLTMPRVPPPAITHVAHATDELPPSDGVRFGLERPPRG